MESDHIKLVEDILNHTFVESLYSAKKVGLSGILSYALLEHIDHVGTSFQDFLSKMKSLGEVVEKASGSEVEVHQVWLSLSDVQNKKKENA